MHAKFQRHQTQNDTSKIKRYKDCVPPCKSPSGLVPSLCYSRTVFQVFSLVFHVRYVHEEKLLKDFQELIRCTVFFFFWNTKSTPYEISMCRRAIKCLTFVTIQISNKKNHANVMHLASLSSRSLSLSLSLSLSMFVCFSLCPPVSAALCLSLSLSLSVRPSLSLSLSICRLSVCLSVSLSLCVIYLA